VLAATWLHKGATAGEVMSKVLVHCGPEEHPADVAALLIRSSAAVVCIVEDDKLLGWIAPHDLAHLSRPSWAGSSPKCSIR
jgi:predicted transcriptional regulator